jgi:hypothetical protein
MPRPLFYVIQEELDLYGSVWPPKLAMLLDLIADRVEQRGDKGDDLDPGETAEWLRDEARIIRQSNPAE